MFVSTKIKNYWLNYLFLSILDIKVVLVLLITICIVNLGTSAMLIYGTHKVCIPRPFWSRRSLIEYTFIENSIISICLAGQRNDLNCYLITEYICLQSTSYISFWCRLGYTSLPTILKKPLKTYSHFAGLKFYWWFCILSLYEIFKQEALQPPPEESTMSMVQCSDEPNPDYASIPWMENLS